VGDRIQKSVFERNWTRKSLKELLRKAAKYLETGDSLVAYPGCGSCLGGVTRLGRPGPEPARSCVVV